MQQKAIQQARQANLVAYLQAAGYDLQAEGQQYRLPGHGGLLITRNYWYQKSMERGGNSVDFLVQILGLDFRAAVEALAGAAPAPPAPAPGSAPKAKTLKMPSAHCNQRRVIAYLTKTRGLPAALVVDLIRAGLLFQDTRGNCVFPCFDNNNIPRGAILRGTLSDVKWQQHAPGSDTAWPWLWPPSDTVGADLLTICESPIDAISLAVLRPGCRSGYVAALGGLIRSAAVATVDRLSCRRVVLALDNDQPGQSAAEALSQSLTTAGIRCWIAKPARKDWNDDLRQ